MGQKRKQKQKQKERMKRRNEGGGLGEGCSGADDEQSLKVKKRRNHEMGLRDDFRLTDFTKLKG